VGASWRAPKLPPAVDHPARDVVGRRARLARTVASFGLHLPARGTAGIFFALRVRFTPFDGARRGPWACTGGGRAARPGMFAAYAAAPSRRPCRRHMAALGYSARDFGLDLGQQTLCGPSEVRRLGRHDLNGPLLEPNRIALTLLC
jgi:hypothetical protein